MLHFAEIYGGTDEVGQRVFDVFIEGSAVLNDYDITADVGPYKAVAKVFDGIAVNDGFLEITFGKVVQNPKVRTCRLADSLKVIVADSSLSNL